MARWLEEDEADAVWALLVERAQVERDERKDRRHWLDVFAAGQSDEVSFYGFTPTDERFFFVLKAFTDLRDCPIAFAERYSETPAARPLLAELGQGLKAILDERPARQARLEALLASRPAGPRSRLSPLGR